MRTVTTTGHLPVTAAAKDILATTIMATVTLRFAIPVTKTNITDEKGATGLSMMMTQDGTAIIPIASHATMISVTILSTSILTNLIRYSTAVRMKKR